MAGRTDLLVGLVVFSAAGALPAPLTAQDCNTNGRPDAADIACGGGNACDDLPGSYDCNGNGTPDECEQSCALLLSCYPASSRLYVNASATGADNGSSWADAFVHLQRALAVAACAPGVVTEIWVARGTYMPDGGRIRASDQMYFPGSADRNATFQLLNRVAIYGGFAGNETMLTERDPSANPTILSGDLGEDDSAGSLNDNSLHVVSASQPGQPVIDGLVITAANGCTDINNCNNGQFGGGLAISGNANCIVRNCRFESNRAHFGGAIAVLDAAATIENSTFRQNSALGHGGQGGPTPTGGWGGGAIFVFRSTLDAAGCIFDDNDALGTGQSGGAMHNQQSSRVSLRNCTFVRNRAAEGGAIRNATLAEFAAVTCQFDSNCAVCRGGAIWNDAVADATFVNCSFYQNRCESSCGGGGGQCNVFTSQGGAVYETSQSLFVNCAVAANFASMSGGALYIESGGAPTLVNCTIAANNANSGPGGIVIVPRNPPSPNPAILNSIIWANNGTQVSGPADVSFSNIQGGFPGTQNLNADPLFVNLGGQNLRLQTSSPCIDAGNSPAVPEDTADLDANSNTTEQTPYDLAGDARFFNDPFTPDIGVPIIDTDGFLKVVDMGAYEYFLEDCNSNGIPDDCDVSCSGLGGLCTTQPGCGSSPDCNSNGKPDECDVLGNSQDCNSDGTPDECQRGPGQVRSIWRAGTPCTTQQAVRDCWSNAANWCPDLVPNNGIPPLNTYSVTIPATQPATLDISPTLDNLTLQPGGAIEVNDASGANVRTLAVDGPIVNEGTLRATDRERLVIDAPLIDQVDLNPDCKVRAGGVIEAVDGVLGPGEAGHRSIVEINGSVVRGGHVRTSGDFSEVHLIGGAELIDVCVRGVVVPDGQAGAFGGDITNSGVLRVAPNNGSFTVLAAIGADGMLQGDGPVATFDQINDCVTLGGQASARLGDFKSSFTNAANHRIDGAGIVFGGLTNQGLVLANHAGAQHLILFPPGEKRNDGLFKAEGRGVLRIESDVVGSGAFAAQATAATTTTQPAEIRIRAHLTEDPPGSSGGFSVRGGEVRAGRPNVHLIVFNCGPIVVEPDVVPMALFDSNNSTISGASGWTIGNPAAKGSATFNLVNQSVGVVNGTVRIRSNGVLNINNSSLTAQDLIIEPGGQINVASTVALSGSLRIGLTLPAANWSWADEAVLRFSGGQAADPSPGSLSGWALLEAAGADTGTNGGPDDLHFGALELSSGAHVSLIDFADNDGTKAAEAVYCRSLSLSAGAVLNLNLLHLYVNGQEVGPGPFGAGTIENEPRSVLLPGDCTDDGQVTPDDAPCFVAALLGLVANPAADLNGDGRTDGRDVQAFVDSLMGL